jgi:hypothetical protein
MRTIAEVNVPPFYNDMPKWGEITSPAASSYFFLFDEDCLNGRSALRQLSHELAYNAPSLMTICIDYSHLEMTRTCAKSATTEIK